ncbi:hypothetical protein [Saccharothrix sp. Mg75]|uniref:hypothetical protein n=1 Tax=Saccharothrix sp. Mg75 TaxID=3445357 RepID=UPI003EEFF008
MTQVFVQPSYGTPEARRCWALTLDRPVPFGDADGPRPLDPDDLARLAAAHPGGTARFWGATAKHDRRMATVAAGDVVLLTGRKRVLAVGEVGHAFHDPAFARRLWDPPPGKCLWVNVYSLRAYRTTEIPYEAVWALPGFTVGDNFMGLRFLDERRGAAVLGLLAEEPTVRGT